MSLKQATHLYILFLLFANMPNGHLTAIDERDREFVSELSSHNSINVTFQKDKAARAVLSYELAKYMSYEKSCAFERLMLPAQLTKDSETFLKHQKWANLIQSFDMTSEMRKISTEENTLRNEIAAKLYHCVQNFNSKTLETWEQRGVIEYAADLYDERMERVYKQLKWTVRTSRTKVRD